MERICSIGQLLGSIHAVPSGVGPGRSHHVTLLRARKNVMHCKSILNMKILSKDVNQVAHTRSITRRHASCDGEVSSGLPTSDGLSNPSIAAVGIKCAHTGCCTASKPSLIARSAIAVNDVDENQGLTR
jgi:hypothetical protein